MAFGMAAFELAEYQHASDLFQQALDLGGWGDAPGTESLYLLLGNTAGRLDHLDEAMGDFEKALRINPNYARAYIGLGEVSFRRALGVPPVTDFAEISQSDLDAAQERYGQALDASDQPPTAEIPVRAAFGLGRVALIRYELSGDKAQLLTAQTHFQSIVAAAQNGNPRITEHAALAHGYLGTIAVIGQDYDRAETEFKMAIAGINAPRVKASFWAQLGDVYHNQNAIDKAIAAYEQAVATAPDADSRALYESELRKLRGTPDSGG